MRFRQRLFIAVFMAMCIFPGIGMLFLAPEENRANQVLSPLPQFQSDNGLNLQFFSELEAYINDHFALRQHMITAYSKLLSRGFASSASEQIIVGKEGWLYYADSASDYLNLPSMNERQAANAAISLSLMQEYALKMGARFLFTIAPNKNSLYPQFMPYHYHASIQPGNLELITEAIGRYSVAYLDLFQALSGSEEILYHRTDSHWNNLGAALAQKYLLQVLGLAGTDYSREAYEIRRDFGADLYEMLYPEGKELDENQYYDGFTYEAREGAPDQIRFAAANPKKKHSLVMYRDSFGNALAPFLAEEFGCSFFSRAVPYQLDWISRQQADFVIIELVERNLSSLAFRAAVMEAPLRALEIPLVQIQADLQATSKIEGNYRQISGTFRTEESDVGSRIYAAVSGDFGTLVYEASPAGEGGEGCFTLYIPAKEDERLSLSLILTRDAKRISTETIWIN